MLKKNESKISKSLFYMQRYLFICFEYLRIDKVGKVGNIIIKSILIALKT